MVSRMKYADAGQVYLSNWVRSLDFWLRTQAVHSGAMPEEHTFIPGRGAKVSFLVVSSSI